MRVFISWSGSTSHLIADVLHGWLPEVIQDVEPWMSATDIEVGTQWNAEISRELSASSQGIIVVTSTNYDRPWLNFEAGALAKTVVDGALVRPLLWRIDSEDIKGPLTQFQMLTLGDEQDGFRLARSLNNYCEKPLSDDRLKKSFDRNWPELAYSLTTIPDENERPSPQRSSGDMIAEILAIVRNLHLADTIREQTIETLLAAGDARLVASAADPSQARYGEPASHAPTKASSAYEVAAALRAQASRAAQATREASRRVEAALATDQNTGSSDVPLKTYEATRERRKAIEEADDGG